MIPKIIHQTWKTHTVPQKYADHVQSWRRLNPEYEHRLYDDQECLDLMKNTYPEFLDTYLALSLPVQKADLFRYLVIHHFGGVYTDLDTTCMKPLRTLLRDDDECIVGPEALPNPNGSRMSETYAFPTQYCQWTFAARAKHPLLRLVCQMIRERVRQPALVRRYTGNMHTIMLTGPGVFTEAVNTILHSHDAKLRIVSLYTFGYNGWHHDYEVCVPEIVSLHHFDSSWKIRSAAGSCRV